MNPLDTNLATFKTDFKKHLNEDWMVNKTLFMQYAAMRIQFAQTDFMAKGINAFASEQTRIRETLHAIKEELAKHKP